MAKSSQWDNDLLKLVFNNVATAGLGDTNGLQPSAAGGSLYLSLHTADPTAAGNQSTSETAYTGYARYAVARTTAGFTVLTNGVNLVANADFGSCTALPGAAITFFGIGDALTGATKLRYSGTLTPTITMSVGVIPRITTAANMVTET